MAHSLHVHHMKAKRTAIHHRKTPAHTKHAANHHKGHAISQTTRAKISAALMGRRR